MLCRFALCLACVAATHASLTLARAQSAPAADPADDARRSALARSLFQEGIRFGEANQWADAADRFERALALRSAPNIENNLAIAYEHCGRLVEALERFRRVAAAPGVEARLKEAARQRVRVLEPRIGRLALRVEGDTRDVSYTIDGRPFPVEAVGVATPADPGSRLITARSAGAEVARLEVNVPEGGEVAATLILPVAPSPEQIAQNESSSEVFANSSDAENQNDRSIVSNPWLWVGVGAVVAAGVIVTAVLLTQPSSPSEIEGNTSPAVLRF